MAKRKKRVSHAKRVELGFLEGISRRCPDNPRVLRPLADLYTQVGRIREGLDVDVSLARLCPEDEIVWYNLGCSYALSDQVEHALEALSKAIDLGYTDWKAMLKDDDLESLREDRRFQTLLTRLRASR